VPKFVAHCSILYASEFARFKITQGNFVLCHDMRNDFVRQNSRVRIGYSCVITPPIHSVARIFYTINDAIFMHVFLESGTIGQNKS
jgi:hypothetical protein